MQRIYDSEEVAVDYDTSGSPRIRISTFKDGHFQDEHFCAIPISEPSAVKWSDLRKELCSSQELKLLDCLIELQRNYDQAAEALEKMREEAFQRLQEAEAADERSLKEEKRAEQAEADLTEAREAHQKELDKEKEKYKKTIDEMAEELGDLLQEQLRMSEELAEKDRKIQELESWTFGDFLKGLFRRKAK